MTDIRFRSVLLAALVVMGACSSGATPDEDETLAVATTPAPVSTSSSEPVPTSASTTTSATPTTTTTTTTAPTIQPPPPIPIEPEDGWELVWNDEFDAGIIDPANWTYDIGGWGWGNGEAQYYTSRPENARVDNGLLIIEARQEAFEDSYYTSARLKTDDLQSFQYGRFEARMKVPPGAGMWPAFWMLGDDFERNPDDPYESNWPFVGEIDVMEYVGRKPTFTFGTVHGPGYSGAGGLGGWNPQDHEIADEFHIYAVEWDESGFRWFYDGELFHEMDRSVVGEREWVFDRPFFLLLNLAVGGLFAGPIGLDTEFPARLYVDYVRVYQPIGVAADASGG